MSLNTPTAAEEEVAGVRAEFAAEITAINLRRIGWLVGLSVGMVSIFLVVNRVHPALGEPRFLRALQIDLVVSALFFAGLAWVWRRPAGSRWRTWFVAGFVVALFAMMDAYNLSLLGSFGQTGSYILGVVTSGVLVLMPPRVFLPLLLTNHAVYLALLFGTDVELRLRLTAAMDGSAGVVVAGAAGWFLHAARWRDFQRERLLARGNEKLRRLNAEMNDLMAITAHDLRSPLEGVRRLLGLLRERADWGRAQVEKAADTCLQSCTGMVDLVGRLLDTHAAEHRAEEGLVLTELDLRPCFVAAAERAGARAAHKGLRVDLVLPEGPAWARAEAASLEQVLDNLLGNACKFSPPGGTVGLMLAAGPEGWRGEVWDEGAGVPEAERARLFGKFHRAGVRATGGEGGSGLGLFIVRTLMTAMGGRVSHAPREPRGSVFRLEWPRARA